MIQIEDRCYGCECYCCNCGLKHSEIHYCDNCECEMGNDYTEIDGNEYCDSCIDEIASDILNKMNKSQLFQLISECNDIDIVPVNSNDDIRDYIYDSINPIKIIELSEDII